MSESSSRPRRRPTTAERFAAKWRLDPGTGCHIWTGAISSNGYGSFHDGTDRGAHRYAYEQANGPITYGYQVDHLCRNKRCVNPDHLEAVTVEENNARTPRRLAVIARGDTCKHGHVGGFVIGGSGQRYCKPCNQASTARSQGRVWPPTSKLA